MWEFVVNDPGEEYFITGRMICPRCRGHLKVIGQELLKGVLSEEERSRFNASELSDRLYLRCDDCGFTFSLLFHLSQEYRDALNGMVSTILDRFQNEEDK